MYSLFSSLDEDLAIFRLRGDVKVQNSVNLSEVHSIASATEEDLASKDIWTVGYNGPDRGWNFEDLQGLDPGFKPKDPMSKFASYLKLSWQSHVTSQNHVTSQTAKTFPSCV